MKMRWIPSAITLTLLFMTHCNDLGVDPPPDTRNKILFTSARSGENQLYMMNPDGSDIRQITFGPYWHSDGRWSPDAKKIVCITEEGSTSIGYEMVVMNVDGSERRRLGHGCQMAWTPDGSRILFITWPKQIPFGLFMIRPDGTERVLLTQEFGGEATFSPDGGRIAFALGDSTTDPQGPIITLMDFPGFGNRKPIGPRFAYNAEWSPTGRFIAFASLFGGLRKLDIFVIDSSGTMMNRITTHNTSESFSQVRWSGNERSLIFISYQSGQRSFLHKVNIDGSDMRKLIDDSTVVSCDWSR